MKSGSAKAKGRRLQKWVAEKISGVTGIPWGKDKLISSREMGQSGTDVRLMGMAKKAFPIGVECKNNERWSRITDWILQAEENAINEGYPDWILFIKRNGWEPIAVLDAELFFKVWRRGCRRKRRSRT